MRKPSCLISCTQPGPDGGCLVARGKHGAIGPDFRRMVGVGNAGLVLAADIRGYAQTAEALQRPKCHPGRPASGTSRSVQEPLPSEVVSRALPAPDLGKQMV